MNERLEITPLMKQLFPSGGSEAKRLLTETTSIDGTIMFAPTAEFPGGQQVGSIGGSGIPIAGFLLEQLEQERGATWYWRQKYGKLYQDVQAALNAKGE